MTPLVIKVVHFFVSVFQCLTAAIYFQSGSVIVSSLEQIFYKEGLRGMYRGLSPTVLALLPNWAVSAIYFLFLVQTHIIFL